jgi:hypothetical protein
VSVYLRKNLNDNIYYSYLKRIVFIIFFLLTVSIVSYAAEPTNNADFSIEPYFTQSIHLKWQDDINFSQNSANEYEPNNPATEIANLQLQGLLVPELGIGIKSDNSPRSSFCLDFSIDAQVYDIYNIRFAPVNFNIKKAYLTYRIDFLNEFVDDGIELQIGRDKLVWGPSQNLDIRAYRGSFPTITGDTPWDMLKYSGKIKLNDNQSQYNKNLLNFTRIFSIFDKKWLIGQRFEYFPDQKWRLGLSEATVINKYKNSSLIYLNPLPIPLFNYFAGQLLENGLTPDKPEIEKDNYYNLGLDVTWFPSKKLQLYTEMILYNLTDGQKLNSLLNPTNYGFTLGGYVSDIFSNKNTDLRIEYSNFEIIEQSQLFSTSLIHDINQNCQLELTGVLEYILNKDKQLNQDTRELSFIIELNYRF